MRGTFGAWLLLASCSPGVPDPAPAPPRPAPAAFELRTGNRPPDPPELEKFASTYRALTGETLETDKFGLEIWLSVPFKAGDAAWLLLQVYKGYEIPGVSYVVAHVFDRDGKRLVKEPFPAGYRMFIAETRVTRIPELSQDVLAIKTTSAGPFMTVNGKTAPAFEQGEYQVEYVCFVNGRLELVRMDDHERRLVRNSYRWSRPMKGPLPATLEAEQWIARLESPMPTEQLAALVWLTGAHLSSTEPRHANVNQQSLEDSKRFEAVATSPKTLELLKKLQSSSNPWVREYAILGLCPTKD
jgi:hypothetical protein